MNPRYLTAAGVAGVGVGFLLLALQLGCSSTVREHRVDGDVPGWPALHYSGRRDLADVSMAAHAVRVAFDEAGCGDELELDGLHVRELEDLADGFAGVTWSPELVDIDNLDAENLAGTAFGHELVHVFLWRTTGDPDAYHGNDGGPWRDACGVGGDELEDRANRAIARYAP